MLGVCFDRRAAAASLAARADRRKSTVGGLNPAEFRGEVSGKVSGRLPYFLANATLRTVCAICTNGCHGQGFRHATKVPVRVWWATGPPTCPGV